MSSKGWMEYIETLLDELAVKGANHLRIEQPFSMEALAAIKARGNLFYIDEIVGETATITEVIPLPDGGELP